MLEKFQRIKHFLKSLGGGMIKEYLSKNQFAKNVITLMTGTAVAQAIPIAITPILTRLYTPDDFGLLALFISLSTIFSSVACGRYELAIMLPQKDSDAINIASIGLIITTSLSLLLLIPIILFNEEIVNLLGNKQIGVWLYILPVSVFLMGFFNVLNYLNIRSKLYKDIAKANIYKSVGLASIQLSLGSLKAGVTGLISGQVISQILANYQLVKNVRVNYKFHNIRVSEIIRLSKRYSDFPKYSVWAVLANTLSYNLTNILISLYYGITTLGFYSLGQRLLSAPTALIGASIGQVFFQEANDEKNKTGSAINTYDLTSKKLVVISLLFFVPLYPLLPIGFEFFFGLGWGVAGEYAQIILPLVAVQFVVAAVTTVNSIFEKQLISLIWQVILLFIAMSCIIISYYFNLEFSFFLHIFCISLSLHYVILWFILRSVALGNKENI